MTKHTAPPSVPAEKQPYQVPDNWRWVRLSDVIHTTGEKTEDFSDGTTVYIGLEHMEKNVGIVSAGTVDEVKSLKNVFHRGQILYGKLRPYLNKHDIAPFDGVCSTDILVFDTYPSAQTQYVHFYLDDCDFLEYVIGHSKGIHLPRVSEGIVLNKAFPLPPLAEQERIVGRLESLFTKLDGARDRAQVVLDGYESRRAAILHKAFTGELTAQWRARHGVSLHDWKHLELSQFASIRGGKRLPKGYSLTKEKTNHPYLRIADFGESSVDMSDLRYITDDIYETLKQYTITENDVYLSIVGTIGKCGTIPKELSGANLTENAAKIATSSTVPEYLAGFLSSPVAQEDIRGRIRSSTLGKLSLLNIGHIVVPVPPKEEQFQIVGYSSALISTF